MTADTSSSKCSIPTKEQQHKYLKVLIRIEEGREEDKNYITWVQISMHKMFVDNIQEDRKIYLDLSLRNVFH